MTVPIPSQVALSPVLNDAQFFDNSGLPLAGGKLFTYEASGATAEQTTFTDSTGTIAASNPVVLDSSGRLPHALWLANGFSYNIVLTQPDGTTVLASEDYIRGAMPVTFGAVIGTVIWNIIDIAPTYISGTYFSVAGSKTTEFAVGNRIQYKFNDNSFAYGTITVVSEAGAITYVEFIPDSTAFSNTVVAVLWSSLVANNYTVDAGGVGYESALAYTGNNVGAELKRIAAVVESKAKVYDTVGSGSSLTVTTDMPIATGYTGLQIAVKFSASISGQTVTININNIGEVSLKQYSSNGVPVNPFITANMVALLMYDGSQFIITTPLPSVSAGIVAYYSATTRPEGWLICDGTAYSESLYPTLFSAIGYNFGGGGGFFNVPNLTGKFVRGYDPTAIVDPDGSSRAFGSTQADAFESHNHKMWWTYYDGGGGRGLVDPVNPSNITTAGQSTAGQTGWGVDFAGGTTTETRPVNMNLLPCIKY